MERFNTTNAAFLSLGLAKLKERHILATPSALPFLKELGTINNRAGEFSIIENVSVLQTFDTGYVPNAHLLAPDALIVCAAEESPQFVGKWVFLVPSSEDPSKVPVDGPE